ncbi:MAG: ABC transporter ATP-binding protein/permease [Coriobacteriales bacterium]|jgi:ABC-type lipoprotein export system ATPase subunit|nr:ABC transporter ATP-binding protein/permease [Coriobacteriales bacterium]
MLELKNLTKSYKTAGFVQLALDDVSVTLRDNEFVAVLGPSGSGKTTLLNIVGGLDHYDSGDLIIDGISTKDYKDRDWDTYRNNRIGFVFQSYNLIPHQSVLANVELALTLSGVGKAERRQRAKDALSEVGLDEHMHKKPNQLSGGQMQRVAIARALINDPEILLADEPTGALDSKTSTQIMALLKNIAADRLVVMVTHNPDLADEYANRIIRLSDGHIVDDSRPVRSNEDEAANARPARQAKMSFLTAIALSFSNLMTKKGRTLMMAFAGSIGIIGIAGILSLANGVNNYIKTVEEDTLSVYPLTISSTGFDMSSLLVTSTTGDDTSEDGEGTGDAGGAAAAGPFGAAGNTGGGSEGDESGEKVQELSIIANMFSRVGSNDLAALKAYLDSPDSGIEPYVNTIQYSYNVVPQIFNPDTSVEVHQVHPDRSFSALGLSSAMSGNSLMSMGMSTDVFDELPDDTELLVGQLDVVAGRWPENYNELVLVLPPNGRVSDFMLYALGLRDHNELEQMVTDFANEVEVTTPTERLEFTHEQLMAPTFKLVNSCDYYRYDENYGVWVDHSDDADLVAGLVAGGETLTISGIVQGNPDASAIMLTTGIYYPSDLIDHIIEGATTSQVVQDQLAQPQTNVFTGNTFVEEADDSAASDFDMSSMFSIDEGALGSAFSMDSSVMGSGMDFSTILNPEAVMAQMPSMDLGSAMAGQQMPPELFFGVLGPVMADYMQWCIDNGENPATAFQTYAQTPEAQAVIAQAVAQNPAFATYQQQMAAQISAYFSQYMGTMLALMQANIAENMATAMASLTSNMAGAMNIDEAAFADAFQFNLDETELTALMMGMMGGEDSSLDNNLRKLGYADFDKPSSIDIYPIDFEGKQKVLDILDAYNADMKATGQEDKAVTYTDIVGTLMSSVTEIINMISMVLVAFVAISLVVSSIMIGVITYISVLERKKEIGILRSIGASKRDIANVFNAETLIVGFVAGCMGILITVLVSIPANIIIYNIYAIPNIALLPPLPALILILVSCGLTFLSGLIPSSAASRKDPVEALRSE